MRSAKNPCRALRVATLVALAVPALLVLGCEADTSGLKTLTVAQVSDLLSSDAAAVVCDANGADTREKYGVLPGAVLLSHYSDYDVAELPDVKARKVVFYCASEACSAAPKAARRAVAQGYSNVYVMPAGIKGWVKAEQPVERPPSG
jgi:rhodanese-related sulfurtransferase